jgi:hypothetical protein
LVSAGLSWARGNRWIALLAVLIAVAAGVAAVLVVLARDSEIHSVLLYGLLLVLIILSALLVATIMLLFDASEAARHGWAGFGLLAIGTFLAIAVLPESRTNVVQSGVGFLPPAETGAGFTLGLSVQSQGCGNEVQVKFVVTGSRAYWSARYWQVQEHRKAPASFGLVLPGPYRDVKVGLGPILSEAPLGPTQAEIVPKARSELIGIRTKGPTGTYRNITVIQGFVKKWPQNQQALIVTALAPWVTHRGIGECNLQLPALSGPASAVAVTQAFTCKELNRYASGSCIRSGVEPRTTVLAPWLETATGIATVTGGQVSSSQSDPEPAVVRGQPEWLCASHAGNGTEEVEQSSVTGALTGGDCHALATVVASPWYRDLVLVLIGAFVAVGVHLLFQGMIEGVRGAKQRHEAQEDSGGGQSV